MAFAIRFEGVGKTYRSSAGDVVALRDFSHEVAGGACELLRGPSGGGKTTILNLMGCLTRPSEGRIWIGEKEVSRLPEQFLAQLRRSAVGFIFQAYNLLPGFTALQNVSMGLVPQGVPPAEQRRRGLALLEELGVAHRADFSVNNLSGGEQQRVAIARALINDPSIILADEPTSNVDEKTGRRIVALLTELRRRGKTVVVASHDAALAETLSPDYIMDVG